MGQKKTLLFAFHETNHTGASLVLFRYVRSLPAENYTLLFYAKHKGPLAEELEKLGRVFYSTDYHSFEKRSVFEKLFSKLTGKTVHNKLIAQLNDIMPDLIVANTLGCSDIIINLKKHLNIPVAWYIHELNLAAKVAAFRTEEAAQLVSFWIVNSEATRHFVQKHFGLQGVHFYMAPPQVMKPLEMESYLPIPEWKNDFIIGSAGSVISRKGYELFIQLALAIKKLNPSVHFRFVWVGSLGAYKAEIEHDLDKCGLTSQVEFTGESDQPFRYYKYFNIFVSTSKEESFGLACLESASLGKPVIGFQGTGGLEEVVKGCHGKLIPYMDINSMASTIVELAGNASEMERMKNASIAYAAGFTETVLNPAWKSVIQSMLDKT